VDTLLVGSLASMLVGVVLSVNIGNIGVLSVLSRLGTIVAGGTVG
jgi:hypothetical protein